MVNINLTGAKEREITRDELINKISGFWIGQLVGNYLGFPFENVYEEEPVPFLVDRYYTYKDDPSIRMNRDDLRGFVPILASAFEGAFSDDDTDIELVTLHAVEKHSLDINYSEITQMWKTHINRKIWVANRTARNLMDRGFVAPDTGKKTNNPNWFQIDPQLVNEIWSAFYPGMTKKAAERAFEKDVKKLVQMALEHVPEKGPFAEGMRDVIRWHAQYPDWRETRRKIHEKYWAYEKGDYKAPVSVVSSLQNGLCGIMSILYGEADFIKTAGIAVSAGYDCDNQSATCAGLIGVMHGVNCIPDRLTKEFLPHGKWKKPFNDQYLNYSRDHLPVMFKISDIVQRISVIAEIAILENGGRKISKNGKTVYIINCDF
jgi:ADP-ribosylglycohydrolase